MSETLFKIFAPMLKASLDGDGKMRLHGVASSTVLDSQGHEIRASALADMEESASKNMTIFLNHEYKVPEDVAGSIERASIRSHPQDPAIKDLVLDIVINEANPRAVNAWQAIQKGTQLGLSIGAHIPEGGAHRDKKSGAYIIEHVLLRETSLVGVPANPRSWIEYAVKSLNGTVQVPGEDEIVIPELVADDVALEEAVIPGSDPVLTDALVSALEEMDVTAAKKPADHQHPHAHEHDHQHDHWNGIAHSHEHAHTHSHAHDDAHEHVDDKQGSEHDHSHMDSYGNNEHPHEESKKSGEPTFTAAELDEHLTAFAVPYNAPADGDGAITASQEAPASDPEHEDEVESLDLTGQTEVEEVESALQTLEPTVIASLRTSSDLLKAITRELIDTKTALVEVTEERDDAMRAAEKVVQNMAGILESLSKTPVGRRAVVREVNDKFASLKSVYSEEFLTLLKKG